MATEKSFQLYINKDNVKHYFTASGGVLNGAQISTKYITMRTSSTTARFTMNDAGRDVLFPSAAAIAHKVDVWAQAIATLNNKENTINVAIAGQNAITTERIHTDLTEYTGSVSGSFTKSNTSAIYTIKILNGFHAAGVRDTSITAYFTQYSCTANKSGNGVKNVSVSNTAPYEGETVTFSAELYNGANFDGWYSNEACTQLVSSNLTYSTTAADLTLYAKATINANLYNVSAVAGSEITSVSVSDSIIPDGDTVTFTAQVNGGCSFEAWYSDNTYTTVVSTENPYTATITADTTLYAKAHRSILNISVGTAEHGTASVSATTVLYGDDVTFTFTPEDETWELYGWYSDLALTQLVSEANPYTFTATEDMTLYPKVGKKRYIISFGRDRDFMGGNRFQINIAVLYYDQLTRTEINYLRTGEYHKIDASKILLRDSINGNNGPTSVWKTIKCPSDAYVAVYAPPIGYSTNIDYSWFIKDDEVVTRWPYYWFQPIKDTKITSNSAESNNWCNCSAVLKEGIDYADATTPTLQGYDAVFEAEVSSGYTFSGWYSDDACTTLVSTDNPAYVAAPRYTTESASTTSLTLYAKAIKATYTIRVGTADHCTTSVSAATAQYGDTVTFNCIVNEGYEFNGWYSDEGLTQLVSESSEYVHSVTGNIKLWPKVGFKKYKVTLTKIMDPILYVTFTLKIASVYYDKLTSLEKRYIKTGEFDKIDQSKFYESVKSDSSIPLTKNLTVSAEVPINTTCILWVGTNMGMGLIYSNSTMDDASMASNWPYCIFTPTQDATYYADYAKYKCVCSAIGKNGIAYVDATTPTRRNYEAEFTAELENGYQFKGWYSDEACTNLISIDNPARIKTPISDEADTSLTLYALGEKITSANPTIYFKSSGSYVLAKKVYKKISGTWVEQTDLPAIFSGESSGTASNYVYGGSV